MSSVGLSKLFCRIVLEERRYRKLSEPRLTGRFSLTASPSHGPPADLRPTGPFGEAETTGVNLGGFSLPELGHRTVRESGPEAVFGPGGRRACDHFPALFPALRLNFATES
jgi:hypothetical protein